MVKKENYLLHILLVLVILFFAFLPLVLSTFQESTFLKTIKISDYEERTSDYLKKMTLTDKLKLITDYKSGNENIILTEKNQQNNIEYIFEVIEDPIFNSAIEEMKKLQELGIFPIDNFDGKIKFVRSSFQTYIDINNAKKSVKIWHGIFYSDGQQYNIWMDINTNTIFQFIISAKENEIPQMNIGDIDKILDYLNLQIDKEYKYKDFYGENIFLVKNSNVFYYHENGPYYCSFLLARDPFINLMQL